tara:strand:+ start:716 stop:1594 length:879 start_codon:yes stop_codon:yes gene_type:complete
MDIAFFRTKANNTFIVIGSNGLIGESLVKSSINKSNINYKEEYKHKSTNDYDNIFYTVKRLVESSNLSRKDKLSIIFCAGKGGFNLKLELANEQHLRLKILLLNLYNNFSENLTFFLISSLGAHLSKIDTPYKYLIESNEKLVLYYPSTHIIRVPSVWGFSHYGEKPVGLIANLLYSLKTHKESTIYGDMNTLRNYLSANTLGFNIYNLISDNKNLDTVYNLSGYFNYSIKDLIYIINKITKRQVLYKLLPRNIAERESYNSLAINGSDIKVIESINTEISMLWKRLEQVYQ